MVGEISFILCALCVWQVSAFAARLCRLCGPYEQTPKHIGSVCLFSMTSKCSVFSKEGVEDLRRGALTLIFFTERPKHPCNIVAIVSSISAAS